MTTTATPRTTLTDDDVDRILADLIAFDEELAATADERADQRYYSRHGFPLLPDDERIAARTGLR